MKYIVPESRMESLVMRYLDSKLKNLEEHKDSIAGAPANWWGLGSDEIFYMIPDSKGKQGFGISEEFHNTLKRFFGISNDDTQKYILRWARINLGVQPDFYEVA